MTQRYQTAMGESSGLKQKNAELQLLLADLFRKRQKDEPENDRAKIDQVSAVLMYMMYFIVEMVSVYLQRYLELVQTLP